MVTDLDLAHICYDLYFNAANIDNIVDIDGVVAGVKHFPEASVICFRGSTSVLDWIRDFQAQMILDPDLGGVECGFIQGLRELIGKRPAGLFPSQKIYVTGHSLGAARALLFAAIETLKGLPIAGVTVFGSPRPGAARIKDILAPVPVSIYKNRRDPVCDVPLDIPLLDPYTHVRNIIPVDVAPPANDPWGLLADHHMELYLNALAFATVAA